LPLTITARIPSITHITLSTITIITVAHKRPPLPADSPPVQIEIRGGCPEVVGSPLPFVLCFMP
jgi:hypothetical protein